MGTKLKRLQRRVRYWAHQDERRRQLEEEMRFHIEAMTEDLVADGVPEADARMRAHRKFGNSTQQAEKSRGTWIYGWMSDAAQDFRYTLRALRRDTGFTVFTTLIIALGIGASCTVFSVLNTLLVRPLPFQDPQRLVWIANGAKEEGDMSGRTFQVRSVLEFRQQNHSFSDVAGYFAFYGVGDTVLTGNGEPERLSNVPVSQNFFQVLGVKPAFGRYFSTDECKWNGPRAVLLSHGLWERRFASDSSIIGKTITLDRVPVTVAGVLPASFDFGSVFAPGTHVDLYSPFPLSPETNQWGNTLALVGRLKPGVSVAAARAEAEVLGRRITAAFPNSNAFIPAVSPLHEHVTGKLRKPLLILGCAVGVVMLIVCANLSNLLLARTASRQQEMAIRAAIGAGRQRLVRQLLTESLTLTCCGAVLGFLFALAATRSIAHLTAFNIPLLSDVHLDARVLFFTALLAIGTGLALGMAPALHLRVMRLSASLSQRAGSQTRGQMGLRSTLVVCEIAFACVLLVGAGLLIRSFLHLLDVDLGFRPESAATLRIDPARGFPNQAQWLTYFDETLRRVRELPGVDAAGITDVLPLGRNRAWGAAAKGQVYKPDDYPLAFVRVVSDGYLKALGIRLRDGRDFTAQDNPAGKPVIIVNEALARRLWPNQNPIGKYIQNSCGNADRQVIGVVAGVRHMALEKDSGSEMYLPIRQCPHFMAVEMIVRSRVPFPALGPRVEAALRPVAPDLPKGAMRPLTQLVDRAVSPRRFIVMLLGGFASFALLLASLGIYGVISYSVSCRKQEIGIRMALGASTGAVQGSIVGQTLALAGMGMLVGVLGSLALMRSLSGLLFGVTYGDPFTFVAAAIMLVGIALLAGYLPARRASRIDPMIALRVT